MAQASALPYLASSSYFGCVYPGGTGEGQSLWYGAGFPELKTVCRPIGI